jgi:anaerobic glycerol-3-phosphate dehydrogenase
MAPAARDAQAGAAGRIFGDDEAFQRAQFLAALGVVLLDVPGVPGARLILRIDPELGAASGERFAPAGFVKEAGDRAVLAEFDA